MHHAVMVNRLAMHNFQVLTLTSLASAVLPQLQRLLHDVMHAHTFVIYTIVCKCGMHCNCNLVVTCSCTFYLDIAIALDCVTTLYVVANICQALLKQVVNACFKMQDSHRVGLPCTFVCKPATDLLPGGVSQTVLLEAHDQLPKKYHIEWHVHNITCVDGHYILGQQQLNFCDWHRQVIAIASQQRYMQNER